MHEAVKVERRACARPSVIGPSASVLPASTRFATAAAKCDADPSCGALYDNKDDGVGFFVCVVGFTLEQARALRSDHCHPSHPIL